MSLLLSGIERFVAPVVRGFFLLAVVLTLVACPSPGDLTVTRHPPDYLTDPLVPEDGCLR